MPAQLPGHRCLHKRGARYNSERSSCSQEARKPGSQEARKPGVQTVAEIHGQWGEASPLIPLQCNAKGKGEEEERMLTCNES